MTLCIYFLIFFLTETKYAENDQRDYVFFSENLSCQKKVIFTYAGKEVRKVTELFQDTNLKIAFLTRYILQYILFPKWQTEKHNEKGMYQNGMPGLSTEIHRTEGTGFKH
jgi:hypothetical protein